MDFIRNLDPIKLLRIALGVSLFSIGYLLTMFYFQMNDLKECQYQLDSHHLDNVAILKLKANINRDNFQTQSQLINQSIVSEAIDFDAFSDHFFFTERTKITEEDAEISKKKAELKALVRKYDNVRNQLFDDPSGFDISTYNSSVYTLVNAVTNLNKLLEDKIFSLNAAYVKKLDKAKTTGFLIALISLTIFVLAYVKMHEDLYDLQKKNDEIIFINETLNNAERVAGFGSWKINKAENRFILSDNFYRLLGEEPNAFKGSTEKIIEYIHPEDREAATRMHQESFNSKEGTTIYYRNVLKDGTVRHMVSVGKFLYNSKGNLVKIGVCQDLTDLMRNSKILEENNARLVAINSELESFNNIVGHDLQEPLRKIQMFISRIETQEFMESASEATVSYFNKIKSSAQRMQNLMIDLVNYTRTIKGDRVFEQVDLNIVFTEILDELSVTIEEKNAQISVDFLPTIYGIKFQILQLFMNLTSNALKYVKPDVRPIIHVRLEDFDKSTVNGKTIFGSEYYKLTVSDNGIGFEQKYADKIFMLFKRLETDLNYQGTGLGLAICKKVMDNNNGFIFAEGMPGKGSIFSLYWPKETIISEKLKSTLDS